MHHNVALVLLDAKQDGLKKPDETVIFCLPAVMKDVSISHNRHMASCNSRRGSSGDRRWLPSLMDRGGNGGGGSGWGTVLKEGGHIGSSK